jgi:NADP-dependent 3-hydroxy acid dehydrogenase YdfG
VTDTAQIKRAAAQVESLDVLINNAGVAIYDDLSDRSVLEQHLAVNLFGPWSVTRAFLPMLTGSQGTVVNVLSLAGAVALPIIPSYSVSQASPESVARAIFAGVCDGEDDIFPDAISAIVVESWRTGPLKEMERQNAALVAIDPVAA